MSSSASRTRSNTTSYLIFAPSQHQKHKLKIPPRAETAWTDFSLGNFPSFHVAVQSGKWQRADCLAMSTLFFPPRVLPPQQTLKVSSLCQIKEESPLLGPFTLSHPRAHSFSPPCLMKASPTRWTLNLNAEEEEGVEKRQGMGNVADGAGTSERPERFSPVLPNEHLFPQELLGSG